MKTSVKLKSKYTINKIHEILCQTVDSGYDIETQGSSVLCRISLKTMRILRLYEFWDKVKITKDKHGESWFEVPFANNRQSYMYNNLKRYEVYANNVEDFLLKYGKDDRYKNLWEKYPHVKESHIRKREEDLRRLGYTTLTRYEGNSEDTPLVYYGRKQPEEKKEDEK